MKAGPLFSASRTTADGLTVSTAASIDSRGRLAWSLTVSGPNAKAWDSGTEEAKGSEAKVLDRAEHVIELAVELAVARVRAAMAVTT